MCLFIDEKHRSLFTGKYKAKFAFRDIWVWKVLSCACKQPEEWKTPCRGMIINFKDGKAELEPYTKKEFESEVSLGVKRGCGYHAYVKQKYSALGVDEYQFKAKIPRGSYYYIGSFNEICSNKLIIYEKRAGKP